MPSTRRAVLAATVLASAPVLAGRSAPAQAVAAGPAFHRFHVGALAVTVVTDGTALRPDTTRGLVVNADAAQVEAAMRAAGLDPARVTLIVHTHFHGDHIGGLTRADGSAVFPEATVAVPEREWAFWMDEGEESRASEARRPAFANARRRFAPYLQRITRFAPDAEVAPGIRAVASHGHSPGHSSFLIHDGNAQALVIGDAITTPAFFMANPEWYPIFDMDPPQAVATRKRLLDRAASERMPVIGYHFDMPATGRVERAGTGYRLVPADA